MTGSAFTPGGYEPDAHERFFAAPKEIMEQWKKYFSSRDPHDSRTTYDKIQEFRKRGESYAFGHYAYEMMYDIYAGIEDDLMDGAIDSHLHIYPDYVPRSIDIIQLAIEASRAKMRAVVCKDHFFTNVGQAWAAQKIVEDMQARGELERACKVYGTHILAWSHHPDQVRLIRKYPNLGAIFFYTMTGGVQAGPELRIVDDNGELMPDVKECIRIAAENKIPIMTGHKKPDLVLPMVKYCHEVGARVLVTHAGGSSFNDGMAGPLPQARELTRLGAFLEVNANKWMPSIIWPIVNPNDPMEYIKAIGPEHIICNTDFGQVLVSNPIEGFRLFIRGMLHYGISKEDVRTMIQKNPARLLYLED
ncbi:MAG: hypothetical protein A2144_14445 [Chloroflexi bacterium RBG_16_50_9]|nr:MAG: hypothetical protein A2144_14445 [Chloroflexi bacterium RBG_16_50_9]